MINGQRRKAHGGRQKARARERFLAKTLDEPSEQAALNDKTEKTGISVEISHFLWPKGMAMNKKSYFLPPITL